MREFFKKTVIIFFILTLLSYNFVYSNESEEDEDEISIQEALQETSSNPTAIPNISSKAAVVIDRNSNTILFGKNENEVRKMASTTKIMTSLIVIENSNLNDIVTVSKKAASTGGSRLGIKTNDKITVNNLLYGLMLCSGNDAAVALAEHVGGSIEGFAELMNKKANELGLKNTHFVTPHGLDQDQHYTTAYELAYLTNQALKNETFAKIVNTKTTTISINNTPKTISNTNELLGYLNGVYGVKTGFTNGANRCLVTSCKRGDLDIVCVVLGADTKKIRTKDSIKLIEYTFSNFTTVNIKEIINDNFENWKKNNLNINIHKAVSNIMDLKIEDLTNTNIIIPKDQLNNINVNINMNKNFEAPISLNEVVGKLDVVVGGNLFCSLNIICNTDIKKKNIKDYISIFLHNYYSIILGNEI